jgi:glycosyltransferase involved in cell wall biosynthesis
MIEIGRSERKAGAEPDGPAGPGFEANRDGITSVVVAAESIGEGCGLGNYLTSLRAALEEQLGGHRRLRVFETSPLPRRRPLDRVQVAIRRMVHPLFHKGVPFKSPARNPFWDRAWRSVDARTVCLLPNVVCADEGRLDDYYAVLSARPLVLVIHDLNALHFPEQADPPLAETLLRRGRSLVACARRIIVHNDYTKTDVCRRLGADPAKVAVARLPSLLPKCRPEALPPAEKLLEELGIRRPYALWASSSTFGHKNHDRLLRAWRMVRERGDQIQLVCTGSKAPRWKDLERLIADLGLRDCVVFTGTLSLEAMWVVLANAALAVCPTLFEGGGSGPVAEAIMMRVPVACARIPQIQEQLDLREDLCQWFDPLDEGAIADAVATLRKFPQAASDRARHAATVYPALRSWEEVARIYWEQLDAAAREQP